jgi:HAD superfamily hydrolase (TIGR01509 family)
MRAAALLDELGTDLMTPGALDLIEGARERGLLLGICTAGSQRSIDRFLTLSRLDRHDFACLLAAEDVIQAKPHPEIYLRACHIVERHPSICAVVEDSPSGMAAAVAAGCPLIVYREPASRVEVDARAMGVAAHLSEVLPFL